MISPEAYFKLLETSLKVFWSWVPITVLEAMIATAIKEAIKAYSMAVAPLSAARNCFIRRDIVAAPIVGLRAGGPDKTTAG
jgi:hypothetical protein